MTVHTRHARMIRPAIGTREHFDWSANGDGLRELEPVRAEEMQMPLHGATVPLWIYPVAFLLGVAITVIGANSL